MDWNLILSLVAISAMFFLMMRHGGGCCGGSSTPRESRKDRPTKGEDPGNETPRR